MSTIRCEHLLVKGYCHGLQGRHARSVSFIIGFVNFSPDGIILVIISGLLIVQQMCVGHNGVVHSCIMYIYLMATWFTFVGWLVPPRHDSSRLAQLAFIGQLKRRRSRNSFSAFSIVDCLKWCRRRGRVQYPRGLHSIEFSPSMVIIGMSVEKRTSRFSERMRSCPRMMSYAFLDGFGVSSILKECLKLWLGANSVS